MKKIVIDIETNAIECWATLKGLKTIHCISILDTATGEMIQRARPSGGTTPRPPPVMHVCDTRRPQSGPNC